MNPSSVDITKTAVNFTYQAPWIGSVDKERLWQWIDNFFLLVRTKFICNWDCVCKKSRHKKMTLAEVKLNLQYLSFSWVLIDVTV